MRFPGPFAEHYGDKRNLARGTYGDLQSADPFLNGKMNPWTLYIYRAMEREFEGGDGG